MTRSQESQYRVELEKYLFDGTEAHFVVDELVVAMIAAGDNLTDITRAQEEAKRRLRIMLNQLVPLEAMLNVFDAVDG
jgi:hypothetical protein